MKDSLFVCYTFTLEQLNGIIMNLTTRVMWDMEMNIGNL